MAAEVVESSAGGLKLALTAPLAPGALVRIEQADKLLLGEIVFCSRSGEAWLAGVKLDHVITGLASLQRLRRAIDDEQRAAVCEMAVTRR